MMLRNRFARCAVHSAVCTVILLAIPNAHAQWNKGSSLSASATVRMVAVLPSSITVSVRQVPLSFDFDPEAVAAPLSFPVTTIWNVNPNEVREFEVVAYFANPAQALTAPGAQIIASRYVLGSVNGNTYARFDQTNRIGPASGSLRLLGAGISHQNARGSVDQLLQVKLDNTELAGFPAAHYSGVLQIEARYY